ncbi:MAG: hypothetical protein ACOX61_02545 [Brooklawnia sp.]
MSSKQRGNGQPGPVPSYRSRPAVIAVIGWWTAAILAVIAWQLLNNSMADGNSRGQQSGIWLVGFAALGSVVGWGASVGSILRDRGRVRAGSICLLLIPVLGLVASWRAVSSTVCDPADPLMALWLVASALLLCIGTLLVVLPGHLGTH